MKLLTKAIEKQLPELYANEEKSPQDIKVLVKFFSPVQRWTWYGTEYSPEHREFFGYVKSGIDPDYDELGYWSLTELEEVRLPFKMRIERDINWDSNITLAEVMSGEKS